MSFIYTGSTIAFVVNSKAYSANKTHPQFQAVVDLCKKQDYEAAAKLLDLKPVITAALAGSKAELRGGEVYYNGTPVHSVLSRRILTMHKEGFPIDSLLRFLENLMQNPSKRAVDELYGFLEASQLPITDDGHFLAYKSVRKDFKDHHTGTMDNSPGTIVKMERNKVDEDKDRTCSYGLHFAAHEYAKGFGRDGTMVILKINPRDVVAIPSDYGNQKGRACEYLVLQEVDRDDTVLVGKAVVTAGTPLSKPAPTPVKGAAVKQFNVGDRVVISRSSRFYGEHKTHNPTDDVVGVVVNICVGGSLPIRVNWAQKTSDTPRHNTYNVKDLLLVQGAATPVYTPVADNYTNGKIWNSNKSRRVFKGIAAQFPVNRDVAYQLTRKTDDKRYSGEFYFTNYTKQGNLVFVRYDREGKAERYVTVANVGQWKITTPTVRV